MSNVDAYKCPSCSAPIEYKAEYGKFKCDYCGNEHTEQEITAYMDKLKENSISSNDSKTHTYENSDGYVQYHCNNCGAEVVSDSETTATFCYYCHSPVILTAKLSGEFKPDKIVPFKISKEKATDIFLNWAKKKRYIPGDFARKEHIDKMTGIYLPYWSVDFDVKIDYQAVGKVIKMWRTGNKEYINTKEYSVNRSGDVNLKNIDEVATDKFEERLLNGISPYEESTEVEFSRGYLSGFFAESYNLKQEQCMPKLTDRALKYSKFLINETISGYNNVNEIRNESNIKDSSWQYVLYPVWIITYIFNNKVFIFAINGQTGRSFGELPVDNKKLLVDAFIIFAIIFILLLIGGKMIW